MGDPVRVVTDSTAALPAGLAERLGVLVVPLQVELGGRSGLEGVDIAPRDVAGALGRHEVVSTSQPGPAAFAAAFAELAAQGATDVVAVHLSSRLSGTCDAARMAARAAAQEGLRVEIVDSRSATMGLGFAVLAAVRAVERGASSLEVAAAAREAVQQIDTFYCLDTLEHARRGGRVRATQALVGAALGVKPILQVVDGAIEPLERVRTAGRALQRLEDLAVDRAAGERVEVAVHHLAAPDRADMLASRLDDRLGSRLEEMTVTEVGAVIGAHGGPGLIGVVVHRL